MAANLLVPLVIGAGIGWGVSNMVKKRVFISFDYDNDRHYRYLLKALSRNSGSEIAFEDVTPGEIQTQRVDRLKSALRTKINNSTHTLVVIGKYANSYHRDHPKIGVRNWQWWEIEKSVEAGNRLIAVKLDPSNPTPRPLYGRGATWATRFREESILRAINRA